MRYFILLGDLPADRQVGYIAIGAAGDRPAAIGHYCVLAKVYDRAGVASALQSAGFGVAAAGPTGMWPDPDRLELQLFQLPAGLVTAAVPSPLSVERDGLLTPRGVDHMMLRVTSIEKSLPYTGWSTASQSNGRAMRTAASGFNWRGTRVSVSSRQRPDSRPRSATTRSRLRRSTAAHSSHACGKRADA